MLVLSRKVGQKIQFPEIGVTITIIQASGSMAKIAIDAPRELTVVRGEIADRAEKASGDDV